MVGECFYDSCDENAKKWNASARQMQRRYLATSDVVGLERGNTLFENLARHGARERERESENFGGDRL